MTGLTVNGSAAAATTLAAAGKLFNATGGTSGNTSTKVGTSTGHKQIFAKGTSTNQTGAGSRPAPTDSNFNGWMWDVTTLEGNNILAGTWTPTFHLLASTGTTVTPTVEWFKRSSGAAYTSIGSVTGSSIALTTSSQALTFTPPSLSSVAFATGDKLVMWLWVNQTAGGATNSTISVVEATSGSTAGVSSEAQAATPGYLPSTNTDSTGVRTLVRTQVTKSTGVRTFMTKGPQLTVTTASDTFSRSNQSGWGTASDNETWSTITGTPTLSISSNEGVLTGTGGNDAYIKLGSHTAGQQQGLVRLAITKTTLPYAGIMLRFTDGQNWYRAYSDFSNLFIDKLVANSYASLGSVAKTLVSGTFYWIRFDASGTTLRARLWQDGTTEPGTWDVTFTDTSLTSGGFGLFGKTSTGDSVQFDSFTVTTTANVMTTGLRAVVRGITKVAGLRTPIRTQVTKSTSLRIPVRTRVTKSLSLRTLIRTQKTVSSVLRTLVRTQRTLSTSIRTLARTQKTASTGIRTVARGLTSWTSLRVPVRSLHGLSTPLRTRVRSQVTDSAVLRVLARTRNTLSSPLRTRVRSLSTKTAPLRAKIRTQQIVTTALRTIVTSSGSVITQSSVLRACIRTARTLSSSLRMRVSTGVSVLVGLRARIASQASKLAMLRTKVASQVAASVPMRIVARGISRLIGMRVRIATQRGRSAPVRILARSLHTLSSPLRLMVRTARTSTVGLLVFIQAFVQKSVSLRVPVSTRHSGSVPMLTPVRSLATKVQTLRIRVYIPRSVMLYLRVFVVNAGIGVQILRLCVQTRITPTATIRIVAIQPNAVFLVRSGETTAYVRDGQVTVLVRSGDAMAVVRSGDANFIVEDET